MQTDRQQLFSSAADCVYTSCYCEENVWHLCKTVQDKYTDELNKCYCVFISNTEQTIPLWCQRASKRPDGLVIWDYHVIFIHKTDSRSLVYDLDTLLEFPCPFTDYVEKGVHSCHALKPQFHRYFRVIPADMYLDTFASDRSHMINDTGEWLKPPPTYPCIQTQDSTNNIQEFINMDEAVGVGTVMKYEEFSNFFSPSR